MIPPQTLSQKFWGFLEQTKETFTMDSLFGIVVGGWIGELETLLKTFSWQSSKTFISNSNIYLKNLWSNFCRSVCIKSDLHYIRFFYDFQKFSAQLFQNALIKWSVMELSRVPGCRLWSCIILKSVSTGDNFLKFLEVKLSPPKVGSEIIPT